jgi:hypothetical protein
VGQARAEAGGPQTKAEQETRADPEGRTRGVPAQQEPQRTARVGPEGQARQALARPEARTESAAVQAAKVASA